MAAMRMAAIGALLGLLAACGSHSTTATSSANPTMAPTPASLGYTPALGDLTGMAPAQVAALLGDPDLRRRDPPAEIWQYRSADCVLDLFFYDDNGREHLVYTESRPRVAQRGPHAARCTDDTAPIKSHTRQTKL